MNEEQQLYVYGELDEKFWAEMPKFELPFLVNIKGTFDRFSYALRDAAATLEMFKRVHLFIDLDRLKDDGYLAELAEELYERYEEYALEHPPRRPIPPRGYVMWSEL